jgi:hypothetical protein
MRETPYHLEAPEEVERVCIPGLVEVLREEGLEAVRYFLWDPTGWNHNHDPVLWRNRTAEKQKREGWETWVRMDKLMRAVLREAHERHIGETMETPWKTGRKASTRATWRTARLGGDLSDRSSTQRRCLATRPRREARRRREWIDISARHCGRRGRLDHGTAHRPRRRFFPLMEQKKAQRRDGATTRSGAIRPGDETGEIVEGVRRCSASRS